MGEIIKLLKSIGSAVGYLLICRKIQIESELMDVQNRIFHPKMKEEIAMINKFLKDISE